MKFCKLYWAGPLFSMAEKRFNRECAARMQEYGYDVLLPQDAAEKFIIDGRVSYTDLADNCRENLLDCEVMVAILDGPDSDSGTSVEAGIKIYDMMLRGEGVAIGVRTDFRKSEDGQLNAMFELLSDVIYYPFSEDIEELCEMIHLKIQKHLGGNE